MKKFTIQDAELLANDFRSSFRIAPDSPIDTKVLLYETGVQTIFRPMKDVYGVSLKIKGGDEKFMLINSNSTIGRQNFSIAHEIYHLFYDENPSPHYNITDRQDPVERCANLFASSLLLPEMAMRRIFRTPIDTKDFSFIGNLIKVEQIFSVSNSCLANRLEDLKLINQSEKKLFQTLPIKEYAKEFNVDLSAYEPGNKGLFIGDYGIRARVLFERGEISEGHYNEMISKIHYE